MKEIFQTRFNGIRDDLDPIFISQNFLAKCENVTFDDIDGANKALFPLAVNATEIQAGYNIDGIYQYSYLDVNNVLQSLSVCVTGEKVYKNWDTTPVLIYTGLTTNQKCSFTTFQDCLYICNGTDYPLIYNGSLNVVTQIATPFAVASATSGNLNGTYRYAMTFTTSGGEEYLGTVSGAITVSLKQITLTVPLGFAGTTARSIYRTVTGGSAYLKVATISDNTTLTYTDTISDGNLGSALPVVNNQMPRPQFVTSSYNRLVFAVAAKYPTQIWSGDTGILLIDPANFSDISNVGDDNSSIVGIAQQFSKMVTASSRNWYTADTSATAVKVDALSVNVGAAPNAGFSLINVPKNATFPGGVMFLSSLGDVRVLNGLAALIPNTLNNIDSENWAQPINGTLKSLVSPSANVYAEYFNYTYHLIINNSILTFNTKNSAWSKINLQDNNGNMLVPNCLAIVNNVLYLGLKDVSKIYKMYSDTQLAGVDYTSTIRTGALPTREVENGSYSITQEYKFFSELTLYFLVSGSNSLQYTVWIDGDYNNPITGTFMVSGGYFDPTYYSSNYYSTSTSGQYRVLRLNRYGRWLEFQIQNTSGTVYFRGYRLKYEPVPERE